MTAEGVRWAGSALAVAGTLLALAAAGWFVLQRTTLNPAGQPARLVVSGVHTWSRNPMYLALTLIYVGVAALYVARALVLAVRRGHP